MSGVSVREPKSRSHDRHEAEADAVARRIARQTPGEGGVRQEVGALLGFDFSAVRLRTAGPDSDRLAADGALAETAGGDVVLAPGQLRPDHPLGRALLAHELTHVAQQGAAPRLGPGPGGYRSALAPWRDSLPSTRLAARAQTLAEPSSFPLSHATRGMRQRWDPKQEVEAVKSLSLEEDLKPGVEARRGALEKRFKIREKAISNALQKVDESSEYGKKLKHDLDKSHEDVLAGKDEAAAPGLRDDILKAQKQLDEAEAHLKAEEKRFTRFDNVFAGSDVAAALAGSGITGADLKALVSQESGDLSSKAETDTKGDIQGIAQIGKSAAKAVGAKPADRTDAKKAIVIAAKVLALNAGTLKRSLSPAPTGEDFKKFVIASYNAGQWTIEETQKQAKAQGKAGATWSEMVTVTTGVQDTPLFKGWDQANQAKRVKIDPSAKFTETKSYVERIFRRLAP